MIRLSASQSDFADETFTTCVARGFLKRRFPRPEGGGRVTVSYPILFILGD